MNLKNRLLKIIIIVEVVFIILCCGLSIATQIQKLRYKATLFVDATRNDFLLDDERSINQKIQSMISGHEFKSVIFSKSNETSIQHLEFMDFLYKIPILSISGDRQSEVGSAIFIFSLSLSFKEGLSVWLLFSIIFLATIPFLQKSISNQIKFENQTKRTQLLNEVASQVAHDIRSPVSALKALSYNIKDRQPSEAEMIDSITSRITTIANDLLDRYRNEDLNFVSANLNSPRASNHHRICDVEVIKRICSDLIEEKKIQLKNMPEIRFAIFDESLANGKIKCDESQLTRVISNLLSNSIEALSATGFISLTLSDNWSGLVIEIRDSGRGMPKDLVEQVYLGPVTLGKSNGNGLGLHSAIKLVSSWDGDLKIFSTIGNGTTISINLKGGG